MISRRTARILAETFAVEFTYEGSSRFSDVVYNDKLYDFLFDHDFSAWFCNAAKSISNNRRHFAEFFMKIHTGESLVGATKSWNWEQREKLGQEYLRNLGRDFLNCNFPINYRRQSDLRDQKRKLVKSFDLDGYRFADGQLLAPEADVLNTEEEQGVLESLYLTLGLANREIAMHCLRLSESNWLEGHWDDCISNARRFLESTMQEVAAAHSARTLGREISENDYKWPKNIRTYLENEGLLEMQERKAIQETYGLLSATGNHPYIAQQDQARLLRQVALIYAQFVMLRLQGCLAQSTQLNT